MNEKIIVVLLVSIGLSFAQDTLIRWEPEMNLSQDTFNNFTPWIECKNDYVHIVWEKMDKAVCYKRSTDGGTQWSSTIELNDTVNGIINPKLKLYGDIVHCLWVEWAPLPYSYEIKYRHSTNNGESWEPVIHIGPSFQQSTYAVKGETLLVVVCISDSVPPNPPGMYYYRSFDNGLSWTGSIFIRSDLWSMGDPDMVDLGDSILLVLRNGSPGAIFKIVTTDWGNTWSDTTRLSALDSELPKFPKICKNSFSYLFVTWLDNKYSPGFLDDVFLRRTTDGGLNWLPEQQITNHHLVDWYEDICSADSDIYLVWPKGGNDNALQFYPSTDMGATWWPIEDICDTIAFTPTIAAGNTKLHVAWDDNRVTPSEIYYKRGMRLPVGIGEKDNTGALGVKNQKIEVYPNPFRQKLTIKLLTLTGREVILKVYDIRGRKVRFIKQIVNNSILWDGCDAQGRILPSGVYICKIEDGGKNYFVKIIKIT